MDVRTVCVSIRMYVYYDNCYLYTHIVEKSTFYVYAYTCMCVVTIRMSSCSLTYVHTQVCVQEFITT